MKTLKNWIFGWILHHANRYKFLDVFGSNSRLRAIFYEIKNQIIQNYGKHICYDLQVIDSQECWTCDGTGSYRKYNHYHNYYYKEACWSCAGTGVYKDGSVIVLDRIQLGKYSFHQPKLRTHFEKEPQKDILVDSYKAMYETDNLFHGYINKKRTAFSLICLYLIFRLHGKKQAFWENLVIWWRTVYWHPNNYLHNTFYLLKHKRLRKSNLLYIFKYFGNKIKRFYGKLVPKKPVKPQQYYFEGYDDLPF